MPVRIRLVGVPEEAGRGRGSIRRRYERTDGTAHDPRQAVAGDAAEHGRLAGRRRQGAAGDSSDRPPSGEGRGRPQTLYVEKLLETYGAGRQETDEFVELAEQANKPGWWHAYRDVLPGWFTAYVSLETGASTLRTYEPHYVTGLLQTPAYARAVLGGGLPNGTDDEVERRVRLRLRRQSLLERESAPTLWVVMEEAVLHRVVAGPDVMREQIDRLLEVSELDHVSIDILPFEVGAHVGACAPSPTSGSTNPNCPTSCTARSSRPRCTWTNARTSSRTSRLTTGCP
ncbi:hypothetical protein SHKM778_44690 [Streptomyces sp. KM77-8]|uniref:DUF5753 domain-containing protein n=1 Tax=Streptomyces haneummycinicus TaxID=3074435 RepID=A0AAT9HL72_9ACTN